MPEPAEGRCGLAPMPAEHEPIRTDLGIYYNGRLVCVADRDGVAVSVNGVPQGTLVGGGDGLRVSGPQGLPAGIFSRDGLSVNIRVPVWSSQPETTQTEPAA